MIAEARTPKRKSKKTSKASAAYLPHGVCPKIKGKDGRKRLYLNCAYDGGEFVCAKDKHGYSGFHRHGGGMGLDAYTDAVMTHAAVVQAKYGVNLGARKQPGPAKMSEVFNVRAMDENSGFGQEPLAEYQMRNAESIEDEIARLAADLPEWAAQHVYDVIGEPWFEALAGSRALRATDCDVIGILYGLRSAHRAVNAKHKIDDVRGYARREIFQTIRKVYSRVANKGRRKSAAALLIHLRDGVPGGITQQEMSRLTGIPQRTISDYLRIIDN